MTDAEIKTAVDYAQFWLEKGREIYEGTDLEKQTTLHAGNVLKLAEELAALKEKYHWRSVAKDGWPQTGEAVEFILSSAPVVLCAAQMTDDNEIMNKYALERFLKKEPLWWRPLYLPEIEED